MNKINDFTYEDDGNIIVFTKIASSAKGVHERYSFAVEGNEKLNHKLLNSVKNKRVRRGNLYHCAKALFEIIGREAFIPLVNRDEVISLNEKFQKLYGTNPEFEMDDLSRGDFKQFTAELLINGSGVSIGEGLSKKAACADALKKHFEFIEA